MLNVVPSGKIHRHAGSKKVGPICLLCCQIQHQKFHKSIQNQKLPQKQTFYFQNHKNEFSCPVLKINQKPSEHPYKKANQLVSAQTEQNFHEIGLRCGSKFHTERVKKTHQTSPRWDASRTNQSKLQCSSRLTSNG